MVPEKKAKIVIASVLKPADDVRMYEKLATTLAKSSEWEVEVWGYPCPVPTHPNIHFHVWKNFQRLSLGRVGVQYQFWKKLRQSKPDVLIIGTHEMLLTSWIYSCIFRIRLIYDIRENYFQNLHFQSNYPKWLKIPMAYVLRGLERVAAPRIRHFLLAEKGYAADLAFIKDRWTIIENKALPILRNPASETCKVVITGTVSDYSQTDESIALFLQLKQVIPHADLTVIGHCPSKKYQQLLEEKYAGQARLILSDKPIQHQEILTHISEAHLAIIGYKNSPITVGKTPTKLFEYALAGVPYIVRLDSPWATEESQLHGCIPVNFDQPDLTEFAEKFEKWQSNYQSNPRASWATQEVALLKIIQGVLAQ